MRCQKMTFFGQDKKDKQKASNKKQNKKKIIIKKNPLLLLGVHKLKLHCSTHI